MAKKLISVWLSLTIVIFSSISIYAEENVQGEFFYKEVIINGGHIENYNLQYPFFLYKDTTYIPLSSDMGKICGFEADMDWESRTLKLKKTEVTQTDITNDWAKNTGYDFKLEVISGVSVRAYKELSDEDKEASSFDENITVGALVSEATDMEEVSEATDTTEVSEATDMEEVSETPDMEEVSEATDMEEVSETPDMEEVSETPDMEEVSEATDMEEVSETPEVLFEEVDLRGMPVLAVGNYVFIPLRAMQNSETFKWDLYYDSYLGLYISTKEGIAANTFWNEAMSRYNKGLVNYILNYNGSMSTSYAQKLTFMFKRSAIENNLDEKLLMAIAHKESTFNPFAVSKKGARGLMQIMPTTGANFGLNTEQLLDARSNIAVGAYIISNGITNYGGDTTKALSAYNQGSARVSRGTYSKAYATRIMSAYSGLQNFLSVNGYVN